MTPWLQQSKFYCSDSLGRLKLSGNTAGCSWCCHISQEKESTRSTKPTPPKSRNHITFKIVFYSLVFVKLFFHFLPTGCPFAPGNLEYLVGRCHLCLWGEREGEKVREWQRKLTEPVLVVVVLFVRATYKVSDTQLWLRHRLTDWWNPWLSSYTLTETWFSCKRLPSGYVIHLRLRWSVAEEIWLWQTSLEVSEMHYEASSLPCSSSCICQSVAFTTWAQRGLQGSLCLTVSLLDNIQKLWLTRLKTKTNSVPSSWEAVWLRTYLLAEKRSTEKQLTSQSNSASTRKSTGGLVSKGAFVCFLLLCFSLYLV